MNFCTARKIAETWIYEVTQNDAEIYREKTLALPYGWVFFYNSRDFIANPSDFSLSLAGNVPILIERINGELRVLGPRYQERLKQIEGELPSACLHMKPEQPYW